MAFFDCQSGGTLIDPLKVSGHNPSSVQAQIVLSYDLVSQYTYFMVNGSEAVYVRANVTTAFVSPSVQYTISDYVSSGNITWQIPSSTTLTVTLYN